MKSPSTLHHTPSIYENTRWCYDKEDKNSKKSGRNTRKKWEKKKKKNNGEGDWMRITMTAGAVKIVAISIKGRMQENTLY